MPRRSRKGHLNINGKLIHKDSNSSLKKLTFRDINDHLSKNDFKTPECQRDLDEGRSEDLLKAYIKKKDPHFLLNETRPIQLGIFGNETYIIDGQHRLSIIPKLCNEYNYHEHVLSVYIKQHSSMDEINERFIEANIDTSRLPIPIEELKSGATSKFYTELKKLIKKYNASSFGSNSKNLAKYTLDAFMNKLTTGKFRGKFNLTDSNLAYQLIMEKSTEFIDKVDYKYYISNCPNLLYKAEKNTVETGMIFGLKKNNSIEWLFDNNIKARHNWKQQKIKISKSIKRRVWNEFSHNKEELCPLCPNTISPDNFHASHIIPEAKGGKVTISNLVPLCSVCNIEMGTLTMEEYCKNIGVNFNNKLDWCKQHCSTHVSASNETEDTSNIINTLVPTLNSSNNIMSNMPNVFPSFNTQFSVTGSPIIYRSQRDYYNSISSVTH